jgi:hypothetical protein
VSDQDVVGFHTSEAVSALWFRSIEPSYVLTHVVKSQSVLESRRNVEPIVRDAMCFPSRQVDFNGRMADVCIRHDSVVEPS